MIHFYNFIVNFKTFLSNYKFKSIKTLLLLLKLMSSTIFTYRIRPPIGLEKTLVKELFSLNLGAKAKKLTGRKVVEI